MHIQPAPVPGATQSNDHGSTALNPVASSLGPVAAAASLDAAVLAGADGAMAASARGLFDPAALAKLAELDPSGSGRLIERVFATFVRTAGRMRPAFDAGWRDGDLPAVQFVAHTLKSAAAYIGALRLVRACEAVETTIREALKPVEASIRNGHVARLPPLVGELDRTLDEALAAIAGMPEDSR